MWNQKFNSESRLLITTLTPVHIGNGNKLNAGELELINEELIAVIDPELYARAWYEKHSQNAASISMDTMDHDFEEFDFVNNESCWSRRIHKQSSGEINELREFIYRVVPSTGRQSPYLPGSSLKGAMRTAVLNELIYQDPDFVQKNFNREYNRGKKRPVFENGPLIANYFGTSTENHGKLDANRDFLRMLQISDFLFDCETECYNLEILNSLKKGWKKKGGRMGYLECLPKSRCTTGYLRFSETLMNSFQDKKFEGTEHILRNLPLLNERSLFAAINRLTRILLESEIKFWKRERDYPLSVDSYLKSLRNLLSETENLEAHEAILRVGGGSGWDFITGGWPKEDWLMDHSTWVDFKKKMRKRKHYPDHVPFPKTRKMAGGGIPLGFIKLEIVG